MIGHHGYREGREEDDEEGKTADDAPPLFHLLEGNGPGSFEQERREKNKENVIGVQSYIRQARNKTQYEPCGYDQYGISDSQPVSQHLQNYDHGDHRKE